MLAGIATETETHRPPARLSDLRAICREQKPTSPAEAVASVVEHALDTVPCGAVFVPTLTGTTARMISRFKPPAWVIAVSDDFRIGQGLAFSYGVHPVHLAEPPGDWSEFARAWMRDNNLPGPVAMLVAGPSPRDPKANYRLEFLRVGDKAILEKSEPDPSWSRPP